MPLLQSVQFNPPSNLSSTFLHVTRLLSLTVWISTLSARIPEHVCGLEHSKCPTIGLKTLFVLPLILRNVTSVMFSLLGCLKHSSSSSWP